MGNAGPSGGPGSHVEEAAQDDKGLGLAGSRAQGHPLLRRALMSPHPKVPGSHP